MKLGKRFLSWLLPPTSKLDSTLSNRGAHSVETLTLGRPDSPSVSTASDPSQMLIPMLSTRPLEVVARHRGGFGSVLIVQDHDGVKYALKTLRGDHGIDWSALAAEASKLSHLPCHPHVIQVIGFVWHQGKPFIILPAMNGSLRDLLREHSLSADAAAAVLDQVASGLAHLHERGILHLDLKPENVLIAENSRYVISDFGLSVFLPSPQHLRDLSEDVASTLAGTPAYMSPEHFAAKHLTPAADVFALGVILFELLTGRRPFAALTFPETAWRIMNDVPSFSALERERIPSQLQAVCLACLEKNPANRPSAVQIAEMPGSKLRYVPRQETLTNSIVARANALAQLGQTDEAEQILDQCLAENPWYLPAIISQAELEYAKGTLKASASPETQREENQTHIARAVEMAETAATIALWKSPPPPGLETLLVNLSCYYLGIDPEQSIRYARQALQLDPEDWQALGNVAEGCRFLGRLDEGLAAIKEALSRAPRDYNLNICYGGLLLAKKDLAPLHRFLNELRVDLPDGYGVGIDMGILLIRIYIAVGQLDEAERLLPPMRALPAWRSFVEDLEREIAERRRELASLAKIATPMIGEEFLLDAGVILKALDPLVIALPAALLGPNESINAHVMGKHGSVIRCGGDVQYGHALGDGRIFLRLGPGMEVSLSKSCWVCIVSDRDGDSSPKRIELVSP